MSAWHLPAELASVYMSDIFQGGVGEKEKKNLSPLCMLLIENPGKAQNFCWLDFYLGLNLSPAWLPWQLSLSAGGAASRTDALWIPGLVSLPVLSLARSPPAAAGAEFTVQTPAREPKANSDLHCY